MLVVEVEKCFFCHTLINFTIKLSPVRHYFIISAPKYSSSAAMTFSIAVQR
nr:hypothetical protein GPVRGNEL_GPVRGNEL_CDS_0029 [Caudoviricetes sp.]